MKKFFDLFVKGLMIFGSAFFIASCEKPANGDGNGDDDDDDDNENPGDESTISGPSSAIIFESGSGSTQNLNLVLGDAWEVSYKADWVEASPMSGEKGGQKIVLSTNSAVTEMAERTDSLTVSCGDTTKTWTLVQRGADGVKLVGDQNRFESSNTVEVTVMAKTGADLKVESEGGWVKKVSQEEASKTAEIGDTGVRSEYINWTVKMELDDNPSQDDPRETSVTVSAGNGETATFTVVQKPGKIANLKFYRSSVAYRFTAVTCGWCPVMAKSFKMALEECGDRLIALNCYAQMYGNEDMYWDGSTTLMNKFKVQGFPTGNFNSYAVINNYADYTIAGNAIINLSKEAVESYKPIMGIAAESKLSGKSLTLDVEVLSKESGDYKLCAYILESGIVHSQSGAESNYVHDNVVIQSLTAVDGDDMTLEAGVSKKIQLTGDLKVSNTDNSHVVVYVLREGAPETKGVSNVSYKDFGTIVDNAISLGLNEKKDFRYEE